jgi:peptide subunit release factor 1 (eRF1)
MSEQRNATSAPPRAVLRRLADVHSENAGVLSIYLDLDPSVFPTPSDRQVEIDSIVREAEEAYCTKGLDHDEHRRRTEAIERVRETLNDPNLAKGGTRSVALFVAPDQDLLKLVELDAPTAPAVVVDDSPYLRPVADEAGPRTWGILLANKRHGRVLYGGPRRLAEVASFEENAVRSRPSYGGWSQASYERHHEDAAREQLDTTIEALHEFYKTVRFDALAIAAPDEMYNDVVERLPAELRDIVRGRVRVEIDFPSPGQVLDAARDVFEEARQQALDEILTHLEERSRDLVMTQTEDVLGGLHERRVMTLVVKERAEIEGVRCPQCSWLGLRGESCPYDGTPTDERPDLVDDAIDMALLQAARVVIIAEEAERQPPSDLSALLRF